MTDRPVDSAVVWSARDPQGTVTELHRPNEQTAENVLGVLRVTNYALQRNMTIYVETDTARGLRDALNTLLLDDGGSAERAHPQATPEGWQAFHGAEHRQLSTRASRIGQQLAEHTTALARIAGRARQAEDAREEVSLEYVAEVLHLLAVQQQRVAASLGDVLSALAGEP